MLTYRKTSLILMLLLAVSMVSASFKNCEGQDFVSSQCTEDGETFAPLLTEHEHSTTAIEKSNQLQSKSSILITNSRDEIMEKGDEVSEGLKLASREQTKDNIVLQSTSNVKKLPDIQVLVNSISKSEETPEGTTIASEVDFLDKKTEKVPKEGSKSSNSRLQAASNPSVKPSKHQHDVKDEVLVPHSERHSAKPSSQSFTQKLHYTVTKTNRHSSSAAAEMSKSTKTNNSTNERNTIHNRAVRSMPLRDASRISQNSVSSNGLKKQLSIKETDNMAEKSVLKVANQEQSTDTQSTATPLPRNKFSSIVKQQATQNSAQASVIKHLLNNQRQVPLNSMETEIPHNGLNTETDMKTDERKVPIHLQDDFPTKTTSIASTSTAKDSRENSNFQNRIRRNAFEEEKSHSNDAVATTSMLTAAFTSESPETAVIDEVTTSQTITEHDFNRLSEKCISVTSCATPVDEELVMRTTPEKSDFKLTTQEQNDGGLDHKIDNNNNNERRNENSKTTQAQNTIASGIDYGEPPPPNSQVLVTHQNAKLKTTESIGITSTGISDPVVKNDSPKAELLIQHQRDIEFSQNWKEVTEEVEILQTPIAIRMDSGNRDAHYGINDERLRPRQRLPISKLTFPSIPQGEDFHIQDLRLSEGLFVFSYLSSFLSWIQPYDFPVELLRDALWKRVSFVDLITESLQVEAGFIACLTIGVLLALGVPCILIVHGCCRMFDKKSSGDAWNEQQDTHTETCAGNCHRVTLVFIVQLVLVLLSAGIVSMFVTNEQMSHAVQQTPTALHTALNDVNTFLRNSHQQLRFVATKTLDQAVDAIVTDLDDIEQLLGRPIQDQIATETGVDIALDALVDVSTEAKAISAKVEALLSNAASTRDLIVDSRERLADLRLQVDLFRRQCPSRFRPLCDTVDTAGLDVVLRIESLTTEQRLTRLKDLKDGNLTLVAQQARGEFQYIPMRVEKDTKDNRNAVKRQLARQKENLYDSAWSLDIVSRDLSFRVEEARNKAMQIVRGIGDIEQWRWLTGLGAASSVLFLWLLLLTGLTCGCCGVEGRAGSTLLATVVLMSLFSVGLWAFALSALLVGGHGEVFICRPLYDEPDYAALTRLVDRPGVLFQRSSGGLFSNLLYGNSTLDVPLRDVLEECQMDGPAYQAFRLHQVFDVDLLSDHRRWENVHTELQRLRADLKDMRLLTPELQVQLQEILLATTVNLTNHRTQISRQVTGRDLGSFADQLTSVANQITDLSTLSRLETLASRTRRLLASHIQPLEQRKEDLVYQLTALEVQMAPLQRQVNQSLSHLRTIQFFIDNKAGNISAQKSEDYVARLVGYMDQFRDHVLNATNNFVAPCRPIWNLYHAMRVLFCRHVMDPLNGFWFATVWCLLLFMVATPPCLRLADHYRHLKTQHQHNSSLLTPNTESPSETLMISDQGGNWSTPGSGEADGW